MKRRAVLGMFGAGTVSTGVLGTPSSYADEEPLSERFECAERSRPECDLEAGIETEREIDGETETVEGVDPKPYSDPSATLDVDSVVEFVRDHERAYARNDALCPRERPERIVGYRVEFDNVRRFDWYDNIYVVRVRYAETPSDVDGEGEPWTTADGYGGAVYAVDETAAVRTGLSLGPSGSVPGEAETPDPLETGTLVDCF